MQWLYLPNCLDKIVSITNLPKINSLEEKVMEEAFLSLSFFCMIIYLFIMKQALLLHLWVNFIILENQQIGFKCKNEMFDMQCWTWTVWILEYRCHLHLLTLHSFAKKKNMVVFQKLALLWQFLHLVVFKALVLLGFEYMVFFHIDELAILEPLQLSSSFSNGDSLIIVVVGITLNH
jgi:hypothetical protein